MNRQIHSLPGQRRRIDGAHAPQPFDFTGAMRRLCADITQRLDEFRHIEMDQVAVSFAQARRDVSHGLLAKLTPLRFEAGTLVTVRGTRSWTIQRLFQGEREMLYILTFYLPRFQNQSFREKLITVMHELFHVSERFDGDIRRFPGHFHVHSHSQKDYDRDMALLVDQYLKLKPPPDLYQFLKGSFHELLASYQDIVGLRVPIPKLIPLAKAA